MPSDMLPGLIGWIVLGVAVWLLLRFLQRQREDRTRRLVTGAIARGWTYYPSDPSLATRWSGPPFEHAGTVSDVVTGEIEGRHFTSFGYSWTEGAGEDAVTRSVLVAAVPLPVALPLLWISPETAFGRFSTTLGAQDIDFESGDFNAAFTVRADDERYAHAVLHPRMMELLLASPARTQPLRIDGDTVLTWTSGSFDLDRAGANATLASRFVRAIPGFALEQFATTAPQGYAGSVTGLRPEPNAKTAGTQGCLVGWAVMWALLSLPFGIIAVFSLVTYGWPSDPVRWPFILIGLLFPLVGLAVLVGALVSMVRGYRAIRLNRRDRQARAAG